MATSPGPVATPCPLCGYDLAALPGTPASAGGTFTADVTCPECGIAVPAGGRVIEGALHPLSLRPNSRAMIVVLAMNVRFFVLIASQVIHRAFRGGPGGAPNVAPWMLIQAAAMGCVVATLGWEVWRRSRFARRSASGFLAGREIRWIVAPTGLECIDRSKPLKQPKRTRIEAARMYCVTGTAEDRATAASETSPAGRLSSVEDANQAKDATPDPDGKQTATRLVAWSWTLDGNGRRIDLEPLAMFTLDAKAVGIVDESRPHATPATIAAELGRILGLPPDAASRPLPWSPFADARTWMVYFKSVLLGAAFVTVVGLVVLSPEWKPLWIVGAILAVTGLLHLSKRMLVLVRRRWVSSQARP